MKSTTYIGILICLTSLLVSACDSKTSGPQNTTGTPNGDNPANPANPLNPANPENPAGPNTTNPAGSAVKPEPTLFENFSADNGTWDQQLKSPGSINFGAANSNANDGYSVKIALSGDPALQKDDKAGYDFANQISTKERLSFGEFMVRAKAAKCSATDEEVITGIFTYSYGGDEANPDSNGNGMIDNNEIDIEVTCSEPNVLWLTVWTDYSDNGHFRKVTRKVNMTTGEYFETEAGKEGTYTISDNPIGTISGLPISNFNAADRFYEMGFGWKKDQVRFFILSGNSEITLWDFREASSIPQNPMYFMSNVWHDSERWDGSGPGDYPKKDAILEIDWFKYWKY